MGAWKTSRAHGAVLSRAVDAARRNSDDHCGVAHLLSALAEAPASTPTSRVLTPEDRPTDDRPPNESGTPGGMVAVTPQLQQVLAMAAGMALQAGVEAVTDDMALLAVCFHAPETLESLGLTPDEVVTALAAEGVDVPPVEPPEREPPVSWGPAVYVDEGDWPAVDRMIAEHLVPQRVPVAFNVSSWRPGHLYLLAEEGTDLEGLVRAVVSAPDRVSVVDYREALAHESGSL